MPTYNMTRNDRTKLVSRVLSRSASCGLLAFMALAASSASIAKAQQQEPAHAWGYQGQNGPSYWGGLQPDFAVCESGHRQSPIDIRTTEKADLPPIRFDYKPTPLDIIDNGHTVMVKYAPGSSIQIGEKKYELKQFHFHHPSEEKINGKPFDMVVHLVHVADDGSVAVVAVLMQSGPDNQLIRELWDAVPKEKNKERVLDTQINAVNLLPSDRGYYTFPGSLTTPPCTENVTWYVLKNPITLSATEILDFSKLYPDNARPTQPLDGRVVQESK